MKTMLSNLCALMLIALGCFFLGCTSNDKNGAGREAPPRELGAPAPPVAASASVVPAGTEAPGRSDPSANGGSSLTASTPYNGNGQTVSQNINPAPFLTASHASTVAVAPNSLISRADGTMSGPNDQPAAGTERGVPAQATGSQQQPAPRSAPKGKRR
jgi:hypothetical protein